MTVALSVRDLRAGYGPVEVLHGVSLDAPLGRLTALLGPNGAGKTTLLSVVAGLLPARGGRVVWDGVDVTGVATHRRARAGMVLVAGGRGVFPDLSVRDNLEVFATATRDAARSRAARSTAAASATAVVEPVTVEPVTVEPVTVEPVTVEPALDAFPVLRERLQLPAGQLSGGEQQMLAMARPLLGRPRLLLLDEVSFGLAPRVARHLFEVVAELASSGTTVVLVEQHLTDALRLADVVYTLRRGEVAFAGEPAELGPLLP